MKAKPNHAADSTATNELSDAALGDILGGCTGYAEAVEGTTATGAQLHGGPSTAPHALLHGPSAATRTVTVSSSTPHAPLAAAVTSHPNAAIVGPSATTPHGKVHEPTGKDLHDQHHGQFHDALDAAHNRFHEALDDAHDGFDHMVQGAAEMAVAAVELNPVVAGLHVLHDLHHPARGTKKP